MEDNIIGIYPLGIKRYKQLVCLLEGAKAEAVMLPSMMIRASKHGPVMLLSMMIRASKHGPVMPPQMLLHDLRTE